MLHRHFEPGRSGPASRGSAHVFFHGPCQRPRSGASPPPLPMHLWRRCGSGPPVLWRVAHRALPLPSLAALRRGRFLLACGCTAEGSKPARRAGTRGKAEQRQECRLHGRCATCRPGDGACAGSSWNVILARARQSCHQRRSLIQASYGSGVLAGRAAAQECRLEAPSSQSQFVAPACHSKAQPSLGL